MTLRSRSFEKKMRKRLLAEVSAAKRFTGGYVPRSEDGVFSRFFLGALAGIIAGGCLAFMNDSLETSNAVAVIWSLFWTFVMAGNWFNAESKAYHPLWLTLPVLPQTVHRHFALEFMRGFAIWPLFIGTMYAIRTAASTGPGALGIIALVGGQSLMALTSAIHLAAFGRWRRFSQRIMMLLIALGILGFFPSARRWIGEFAPAITAFAPSGWVVRVVQGSGWQDWLFVIPIGLFAAAVPASIRQIRSQFSEQPYWSNEPAEPSEDEVFEAEIVHDVMQPRGQTGIEEAVEAIRLEPAMPPRHEGWVEQLGMRFLRPDERQIAHYLWPFICGWTAQWAWALKLMVVLAIAAIGARSLIGASSVAGGQWLGVGLFAIFGLLIPLGATEGARRPALLRRLPITGGYVPIFACYPIAYNTLYSTLIKTHVARLSAWAPFYVLFLGWITVVFAGNFKDGFIGGLRIVGFCFVIQPLVVGMMLFSPTRMARDWAAILFLPLMFIFMGAMLFAVLMPIDSRHASVPAAFGILYLTCKAFQRIFRSLHRGRSLDMISARES